MTLHALTQKIVWLFKDQRNPREYQFAVLILMPAQSGFILWNGTRLVSYPDEVTDRNKPTFPFHTNLCNFVVARPDGGTHAEVALMKRFVPLLRSYNAQRIQECRTILLYSWLFPCNYCKREIISTLGPHSESHNVLLIYTSTMKDMDSEQVTRSTRELVQSGVRVKQENFDEYLPPGSF